MKLDELMREYRASLPEDMPLDFASVQRRAQRRKKSQWGWIAAGLAVAASIAGWMVWPNEPQREPLRPQLAIRRTEVMAKEPEVAGVPRKERRRFARTAPAPNAFVELGSNAMLPEPDLYQILRVSVSGPRLAALGVLKPGQTVSEMMTAEVLLGDDGVARAIRVVAEE